MTKHSLKTKKLILEILTRALENSKAYDHNWLFLCNQVAYASGELYPSDYKLESTVCIYFNNKFPTPINKYKEFYKHEDFRVNRQGAWWRHNDLKCYKQRIKFLESVITNLQEEINADQRTT